MTVIQHGLRRAPVSRSGYIFLGILLGAILVFLTQAVPAKAATGYTISNTVTGGDCASIGAWDPLSKTCTLSADLVFAGNGIVIGGDGITLDGAGHTIAGSLGGSTGVSASLRSNVTIRNLTIKSFGSGIYLLSDTGATVSGSTLQGNAYGVYMLNSGSSRVYNNDFLSNTSVQAYVSGGAGSVFSQPAPRGGNYWSNFSSGAQGCNDANADGFCDTAYTFTGGSDQLPWTSPDGWSGVTIPDTTPPVVTGIQPSGIISRTAATISVYYGDTGGSGINTASVTVYLDGSRLNGCSVTAAAAVCGVSGLANGSHTISVDVADNAGNAGSGSGSFTVAADTTPPVVTNVTPAGFINATSTTVHASYSDSGSGIDSASVRVYLDGTRLSGCNATVTGVSCGATNLADGAHTVSVTVADLAGNSGNGSGAFTEDSTAPAVVIAGPGGTLNTSSATISAYYSDGGSGINSASAAVYIDGARLGGCQATAAAINCQAVNLTNGVHSVIASVQDNAGNTGVGSASFTVAVPDTAPPVISAIQPAGTVTSTSATISASYADTGSGINAATASVYLDGAAMSGCTRTVSAISCNVSGLGNGVHNLTVYVADNAGNAATAAGSFTVQVTAAKVIRDAPGGGDCPAIGSWDVSSKTCTLSGDLTFSGSNGIIISGSGITLDGAGHKITGSLGSTTGVSIQLQSNVTVRNLTVASFSAGIYVMSGSGLKLTGDTLQGNNYGLFLSGASSSLVYGNNFISNATAPAYVTGGSANAFSQPAPVGGNYWSGYSTADQGCGDADNDGFCDAPYNFTGGSDALPRIQPAGLAPDTSAPKVTRISPSGTIASDSATISVYYTDTGGSGINTAAVAVYLDGAPLSGCIARAGSASCNAYGLANGTHTITVSVADNAGNTGSGSGSFTVNVDRTPPVVSNVLPAGWVNSTTATVHASYADTGGSGINTAAVNVYVDGARLTACNATVTGVNCTAAGLAQGPHAISVNVSDKAGNTGSGAGTFQVDSILPVVAGLAPDGILGSTSATISAYYSDSGAGIDAATAAVYLDGSRVSGCNMSATAASCAVYGLAQGPHNFSVSVADAAGNKGTQTGAFFVDTVAPAVKNILPSGWVASTSATISAYYADGGSGIDSASARVYVDGARLDGCSATATYVACAAGGLSQGGHSVIVSVADNAGNVGSAFGSFQVDSIAPAVTNILPAGASGDNSAVLSAYYADAGSGIDAATAAVYLDGSRVSGCSFSATAASCAVYGLAAGTHQIGVTVADMAGNTGSGQGSFIVDGSPPVISSILPAGWINSTSAVISAYYADAGVGVDAASVAVYLDGNSLSGCAVTASAASCAVYGLAPGPHTITVNASDKIGHPASASGSFSVDTEAPQVAGIQPTGIQTESSAAVYAYYADSGSGIDAATAAVYLDGNRLNGCSLTAAAASCNVYGLAQGSHTVTVTVNDNAGNAGSASGSFVVDTGPPVITRIDPSGWTNNASAAVTAYYSDAGSGINAASAAVYLDGSRLNGCTLTAASATCATYGLAPGAHSVSVSVADNIGNVGTGSGGFKIDTAAPSISQVLPSGWTNSTSAVISAYYSDAGSGIDSASAAAYLDGAPVGGCAVTPSTISCPVSGIADGNHGLSVRVADLAGNASESKGSLMVDTSGPVINGIFPNGTVTTSSATVAVYYSDAGSGVDAASVAMYMDGSRLDGCHISASMATCDVYLTEGAHTVSGIVADHLGNSTKFSQQFSFAGGKAMLTISKPVAYWASMQDYQDRKLSVLWTISNNGTENAYMVRISGSANTHGVSLITKLPLAVSDIMYKESSLEGPTSSTFILQYQVPPGVNVWNTLTTADADDASGSTYTYPQISPTNRG